MDKQNLELAEQEKIKKRGKENDTFRSHFRSRSSGFLSHLGNFFLT